MNFGQVSRWAKETAGMVGGCVALDVLNLGVKFHAKAGADG